MANKKKVVTKGNVSRGKKFSWVGLIAFTVAAGFTVGVLGYGSNGFKDWGFNRFAHKTQGVMPEGEALNGSVILDEDNENSNGIRLLSATLPAEELAAFNEGERAAEQVIQLEAVYTPDTVTATATDWSIKYIDGTDVSSDTMTLTTAGDGSTQATLTCYKFFTKKIQLTVSSRFYDLKLIKNVDYLATPAFDGDYDCCQQNEWLEYGEDITVPGVTAQKGCNMYFEQGTLNPDAMLGTVTLDLNDAMYNYLTQRGWNIKKTHTINYNISPLNMQVNEASECFGFYLEQFLSGSVSASEKARLMYDYKSFCENNGGYVHMPNVNYTAHLYYKGKAYREVSMSFCIIGNEGDGAISAYFSSVTVTPPSLNVGDDVVFG